VPEVLRSEKVETIQGPCHLIIEGPYAMSFDDIRLVEAAMRRLIRQCRGEAAQAEIVSHETKPETKP
jgi:hypothetical protein